MKQPLKEKAEREHTESAQRSSWQEAPETWENKGQREVRVYRTQKLEWGLPWVTDL